MPVGERLELQALTANAPSDSGTSTTNTRIIPASFVKLQDIEFDGTIETIAAHIMIRNVGPPAGHRARGFDAPSPRA